MYIWILVINFSHDFLQRCPSWRGLTLIFYFTYKLFKVLIKNSSGLREKGVALQENSVKEAPCLNKKQS